MSEENVELHYRSIDAVNRRDLEAFLALMDVAVEAVSRIVTVEGGLHAWWQVLRDEAEALEAAGE
jgi:hypothetical protein